VGDAALHGENEHHEGAALHGFCLRGPMEARILLATLHLAPLCSAQEMKDVNKYVPARAGSIDSKV
jgi:hypothetical protein